MYSLPKKIQKKPIIEVSYDNSSSNMHILKIKKKCNVKNKNKELYNNCRSYNYYFQLLKCYILKIIIITWFKFEER